MNNIFFEGSNIYVGVVLSLRIDHITKKFTFDVFQKKSADYAITPFKNGGDIRVKIKNVMYHMLLLKNNHKQKPLVDEENRTADKKGMEN